jgi:excisionase family DNA binding protein
MANMELQQEPKLLSLRDAASRLTVAVPTLRRWLRQRRLGHIRCGRAVRIEPEEIERFITANRRPARGEQNG